MMFPGFDLLVGSMVLACFLVLLQLVMFRLLLLMFLMFWLV